MAIAETKGGITVEELTAEIKRLQNEQCVTCRYANQRAIGKGPCCTFGAGPMVKDGVCFAFASTGDDPEYRCRWCDKLVRVKAVEASLFATRQCPQCYTKRLLEDHGEDRLQ